MKINFNEKKINNDFRSGFVGILGNPNVGKSTLINSLIGQKISITSKKPQTTRNKILGILNNHSSQIIFIDTPGIHKTKNPLNNRIIHTALTSINSAEIIIIVVDGSQIQFKIEQILSEKLKKIKIPIILAINKIDKIKKTELLNVIKKWSIIHHFNEIIPICARSGYNLKKLIDIIKKILPIDIPHFPLDKTTNMSKHFIISEIIREKTFRLTGDEIPYSVAVTIDKIETQNNQELTKIYATIHVERDSQKGIIIGKKGKKIQSIGASSRIEIKKILKTKIFLNLFIKVEKNWCKNPKALTEFGY